MIQRVYYDDIELGTTVRVGSYRIDAEDIVSYARRWDPLPVHVDEAAARQTIFGGLTASGSHTLAIRTLLLHPRADSGRGHRRRWLG